MTLALEVTKRCNRCGLTKPIDQFHSNGGGKLRPECGVCCNTRRKEHYGAQPGVFLERQRRYRERLGSAAWRDRPRRWRLANPDYYARNAARLRAQGRIKAAKRRAIIAGVTVERVDPKKVFARDHGICGICTLPVAYGDFQLDHVVALSQGGAHSYANVQVSHAKCNQSKGAR